MLRVTVELHSARTGEVETLGVLEICNQGNRDYGSSRGDYHGRLFIKGTRTVMRTAEVFDFPRHSYHVCRLVLRVLRKLYPEEK